MVRTPVIQLRDVLTGHKKGRMVYPLNSIPCLDLYAGDFVAVVGMNGVGKSTLLRSVSGLSPLIEGRVMLEGEEVNSMSSARLATKVAVVLTHRLGGFNLKVKDLVAAGQMPYTGLQNKLSDAQKDIVDEEIARCGLSHRADTPADELSDGQFQKAMIARALAQRTGILLLDEPAAFLDYPSKHELFILLRNQAEQGKMVLITTHDLDHALKYCNAILLLEERQTRLMPAEQALTDPGFLRVAGGFLGSFQ